MIEKIVIKNELFAIIIRKEFKKDGIEFFTPNEFSQQLAYMRRPSGYKIEPHLHQNVKKEIKFTQEVLFIRSGKIRVDFYDNNKDYQQSTNLNEGDIILLSKGGHGFKVLEECEIIEVKQGPYDETNDKTRFKGVKDLDTKIK
tara:strand:- start:118 stop:546 length:429 start_codon:yes stop_codon:yes gene_type:complete